MSNSDRNDDEDYNKPLELEKLKPWISEKTYEWIKKDDLAKLELAKQIEDESAPLDLFGNDDDDSDDGNTQRVQTWTSSVTSPDGIGGFQLRRRNQEGDDDEDDDDEETSLKNPNSVSIFFILSESYDGFGDTLWSSGRHVANLLANPITCRELLKPIYDDDDDDDSTNNYHYESPEPVSNDKKEQSQQYQQHQHRHPLVGKRFVELGAGAGVPSWTAMKCGARVVSTDLASANRIRCMAECIQRNYEQMSKEESYPSSSSDLLQYASTARACPCQWGRPVDDVLKALNQEYVGTTTTATKKEDIQKFEIIIAADCCYMPWSHNEMLDTINELLEDDGTGVAIVPFALHGNTDDDDVWGIVNRAKTKGFVVEQLPTTQLTPPGSGMEDKQGLVHTLRLTRRPK